MRLALLLVKNLCFQLLMERSESQFFLKCRGVKIRVKFTRNYFSTLKMSHFAFFSLLEPAQPIPISPTGYRSHFVNNEVIDRFESPAQYAFFFCKAFLKNQKEEPSSQQILACAGIKENQSNCIESDGNIISSTLLTQRENINSGNKQQLSLF